MKRCLSLLLIVVLLAMLFPLSASAVVREPSRVIHVVYDDSGSMYTQSGVWSQAKYSMEVFAAMLGSNDRMNIYYMSDYDPELHRELGNFKEADAPKPRLSLNGGDSAVSNVSRLHAEKTQGSNTPFNAVRKAYFDLQREQADEKWLVILTDGEFEDGRMPVSEIDRFLAAKDPDIQVMFMAMGNKSGKITANEEAGIYYVQAKSGKDILREITGICTRIFNSNRISLDPGSKRLSLDVPMGELIVFAQGENVQLKGIRPEGGDLISPSAPLVNVKYSDCDAVNYANREDLKKADTSLVGVLGIFQVEFDVGEYVIEVEGADTLEVFYKPDVEIAAFLRSTEGEEVTDISQLSAGSYILTFGFVKRGTQERLGESSLLGKIDYEATVTQNGVRDPRNYTSGDTLEIQEGSLQIDVTASFLTYNSVSTELNYTVLDNKAVSFVVVDAPTYVVLSEGFESTPPTVVEMRLSGKTPTAEQWAKMDMPHVRMDRGMRTYRLSTPRLEKGSKPGELLVYPVLPGDKPSTGTYTDTDFVLTYEQDVGMSQWSGEGVGTFHMTDTRSWWERNWDLFVKLAILLAVLFLICGYLPLFKHYLPKSLKKKPYIKCVPSEPGEKRKDRNGEYEKNLLSTILPYVPQTGKIKYVPKGVTGAPPMMVRGIKSRRMALSNFKAFIGKDYITFDGAAMKKDIKKYETGAGLTVRTKRGDWTYHCTLNQENK